MIKPQNSGLYYHQKWDYSKLKYRQSKRNFMLLIKSKNEQKCIQYDIRNGG